MKNKNYEHVQTDHGINGQYKTWFLDYASYVILERAVPARPVAVRLRDPEPGGVGEVRGEPGRAPERDVLSHRLVCVQPSDRHGPVQVRLVDRGPANRARPLQRLLGQEGEVEPGHHPADREQRGSPPGTEDGRDQRV